MMRFGVYAQDSSSDNESSSDDSYNSTIIHSSSDELSDSGESFGRSFTPQHASQRDSSSESYSQERTRSGFSQCQTFPIAAPDAKNEEEAPWKSKIQKPYDTKADKQRLGRWIGGSLTVTKKEKQELDAKKMRNRKK